MARKHELAHASVSRIHGTDGAQRGQDHFRRVVQRKELPDDIPEVSLSLGSEGGSKLFQVLVRANLAPSKSEARRLVQQGAVSIDQSRATDPTSLLSAGKYLIQVGKRRFARVQLAE
jgi:tyrosyl-tRNA synthetase